MSTLPHRVEQLFLLFKEAIEDERAAQKKYLRAMELCDDENLRNAFKAFHDDEVRHERDLVARYSSMRQALANC